MPEPARRGAATVESKPGPPSPVEAAIAALAEDREHGATELAREALSILDKAVESFPEEGLGAYLDGVGVLIVLSRPSVAAVKNAVSRALADGPLSHPGQAKRAFDRARSWIDYAAKAAAEEAAAMLPNDSTIVTCSYSEVVLDACASAVRQDKDLRVVALASRVGEVANGERMAEALRDAGVRAEIHPDSVDIASLGPVAMGLVGADRVAPDGSMIGGVPSLLLGERLKGVAPLYVVAETFKLDDGDQVEDGLEPVPASMIAGYVTDRGVVTPGQVWELKQPAAS